MTGRLLKTAVGAAARRCIRAGDRCASIIVAAMFQLRWDQNWELNSVAEEFVVFCRAEEQFVQDGMPRRSCHATLLYRLPGRTPLLAASEQRTKTWPPQRQAIDRVETTLLHPFLAEIQSRRVCFHTYIVFQRLPPH